MPRLYGVGTVLVRGGDADMRCKNRAKDDGAAMLFFSIYTYCFT
jgi:hypothetical protein